MKEQIAQALEAFIREHYGTEVSVVLERPKDRAHGDWTSTIAFALAKTAGVSPAEIAQKIAVGMDIERVSTSAVGPYMNFTYEDAVRQEIVVQACRAGTEYGKSTIYEQQRILVEHSSPNLFKPFHIGHLVNNTVGESLVRLMQMSGAKVIALSYPSDVSLGIAKAVWGAQAQCKDLLVSDAPLAEKMQALGDAYAYGVAKYDEDDAAAAEMRECNIAINHKDTAHPLYEIYETGKVLTMAYFEEMTATLGSQFDGYVFESETGPVGRAIVEQHTPETFQESDGAVIFAGEKYDLHTRVFINKEGLPTYEAKDIGLLHEKFDRFDPAQSFTVTDHEQSAYFKVIKKAAGEIDATWEQRTEHVPHGRLGFQGMKISSRLGNVPLAEDVVNAVEQTVHERIAANAYSRGEVDAQSIAIAAIKFVILKTSLGKNMTFDKEQSLSFEGDSGPYVQYTHARCKSVIAKAKSEGVVIDGALRYAPESRSVTQLVEMFPEIVERAIAERAPHTVAAYLLEMAHAYNGYYAAYKIVDAADPEGTTYRVQLSQAVATVLANGLHALGITALDHM